MITPVSVSLLILIVTYTLLFIDKVHRTIIGLAGAAAMVLAGKFLDFYETLPADLSHPLENTALGAIDWNTLGLLFGMMVIVAILEETGVFEYIAIRLAKLTQGSYWLLMMALGWFTFLASALLDNVTTVILVSSITVSIASLLKVNPVPLLISEAIMSGIGGMATLVGDPPNIMIGSAAGLSFLDFVIYLGTVALVVGLATSLVFRWLFRGEFTHQVESPQGLDDLDENEALRDRKRLKKMALIFSLVLIFFVVHHKLDLLPMEVALSGAAAALLWIRPNLFDVFNRIRWDVLLFFGGLFVIVGGLEAAGILRTIAEWIGAVVLEYPLLALLVVLWGAAVLSAIVDNIPFTIALIPIILNLEGLGAEVFPLWWALAAGVAIGGCATPIGASANVYVVSLSERSGVHISFQRWLKVGVPAVLAQLVVASVLLYGMFRLGLI